MNNNYVLIKTDKDTSLQIENFAIVNLGDVSTVLNFISWLMAAVGGFYSPKSFLAPIIPQ